MNEDSSYKTQYGAFYFDGINPIKHEVNVTITRDGLKIQKLKVDTYFWWDLSEINQTNDIYADKEVKLEKFLAYHYLLFVPMLLQPLL